MVGGNIKNNEGVGSDSSFFLKTNSIMYKFVPCPFNTVPCDRMGSVTKYTDRTCLTG